MPSFCIGCVALAVVTVYNQPHLTGCCDDNTIRLFPLDAAGKSGTTNDLRDAWFVGFTPDLTVGVFMGYDQPKPMGRGSTGGSRGLDRRRPCSLSRPRAQRTRRG